MGYNMSELEKNSYNGRRKARISKSGTIISNHNAEKRGKANYQKYGNGKMIDDGIAHRLGIVLDKNISNDAEKKAFFYGLYEGANAQLDTMAKYNFIPERIKNKIIEKLLKENKEMSEEEIKLLFQDKSYEQNMINNLLLITGRRDSGDLNVIFEELPQALRENEYYLQGYNRVQKEKQNVTRKR